MVWVKRIFVFVLLVLLVGATFARRSSIAPVIDAESGVMPTREQVGDSRVVVFVLDSSLDPAFVLGRTLDVRPGSVSHGSLVARVVRRYCRVTVVGMTAEDFSGAADTASYLRSLNQIADFARQHPNIRVIVNISLGRDEQILKERDLINTLRNAGALLVAAAGNDNADERVYPASYPNTISVASANVRGKQLHSNYGQWIDIAASGDISFVDEEHLPYEHIRRQMSARGTSFAAPRVSATVAWLLSGNPGLKPIEAWRQVQQSARPITDELYERGDLGAGFLDIYRFKTAIKPAYSWVHYGLPTVFFCVVGVGTVVLVLRLKFAGVFVGLLIWLTALPAGIALAMMLRTYFECVQAGYQAEGPWPITIAVLAVVAGTGVVRWRTRGQICGLLPGVTLAIILRLAGVPGLARTGLVASVLVGGAVLVEWKIRRRITSIRRMPQQRLLPEAVEALGRAHDESKDARVRKAIHETLDKLPREEVLEYVEERKLAGEDMEKVLVLLEEKGWLESSSCNARL